MTQAEKHDVVLGLMHTLHPREQQVLLLRLEEGLSYKEISRVTGRSEGNVGNLLHHAVRKLSTSLKKAGVITS
jgi:RNA polymerase sigma-70 factor (ECF subfamily)